MKVKTTVIARPDEVFRGKVMTLATRRGPPWDRRFECKLYMDEPMLDLRPGMSTRIEIITAAMPDALWLPSQAVFDRGSQTLTSIAPRASFLSTLSLFAQVKARSSSKDSKKAES